ncbi:hypothetical protein AAHB37_12735 [Glutamicibacter halophytocola]|uniref:hypothetical protein n=1 Tax=Glutamicibacter halophytocola TaxID=1933880 RepID=UPI003219363F
MLKKIGVTTAVIALGLSALTGCSSGKLSTEETCTLLTDKAKELSLAETTDSAVQDMLDGDGDSFKAKMAEVTAFLREASDKTEDEKLAEALQVSIDQNNQMIELMTDNDLTLMEKSSRVQGLSTAEDSKTMDYVSTACSGLAELGQ